MEDAIIAIQDGQLAVIPTDTLYGITASVHNVRAIERIYEVKGRDKSKPLIVLVADASDLREFGIKPQWIERAESHWPAPVSVIVPAPGELWSHIHRGTNSIAFRVPDNECLATFLRIVGPIVAPSANPEGLSPARSIEEAKQYFGDSVSAYWDEGERNSPSSKIIRLEVDEETVLRS